MIPASPADPATLRRIRRDPRFREALRSDPPAPGWRDRGECLRHDPELFFPTAAEDSAAALQVCAACRVRGTCLATALAGGECDGVWGGTTPGERRIMRHAWVRTPVRLA